MFKENWNPFREHDDFMRRFRRLEEEMLKEFRGLMEAVQRGELEGDFKVLPIDRPGAKGYVAFGSFSTSGGRLHPFVKKPAIVRETPRMGREPLIDVVEEGDEIVVVAEVPGVAKEDIKLDLTDEGLEIEAGDRFYKSVALPEGVTLDKGKASYKNGVLEVHLSKKPGRPKKEIKIE